MADDKSKLWVESGAKVKVPGRDKPMEIFIPAEKPNKELRELEAISQLLAKVPGPDPVSKARLVMEILGSATDFGGKMTCMGGEWWIATRRNGCDGWKKVGTIYEAFAALKSGGAK